MLLELEVHRQLGRENHKCEVESSEIVLKLLKDELKLMSILVVSDVGGNCILQKGL